MVKTLDRDLLFQYKNDIRTSSLRCRVLEIVDNTSSS
jgi:hypothetical protein